MNTDLRVIKYFIVKVIILLISKEMNFCDISVSRYKHNHQTIFFFRLIITLCRDKSTEVNTGLYFGIIHTITFTKLAF